MRGDQSDHSANRNDSDDGVEGGEERRNLVTRLAGITRTITGRSSLGFSAKLRWGKKMRTWQRRYNTPPQRDAVAGNGDDGDIHAASCASLR